MAIYEITADSLRELKETSYAKAGVKERNDLQRLLRMQVEVISPDTLVIAEEFGEWTEGSRRIDLLGVDKDANLVVIELKRTDDGGHMELQAIRYAAMVSAMTFDRAVEVFSGYLNKISSTTDAREALLEHLDWSEPDEDRFAQDVRIILASAEFSRELTTAVLWLNERDLDIRCMRMKPYQDGEKILIDVQQIVPLPEASAYTVQVREKERRERKDRAERYSIRKRFWSKLLEYANTQTDLHSNISPSEYHWIGTGSGVRGLAYTYKVTQHTSIVDLYIDRGAGCKAENKKIFDTLYSHKDQIEAVFGGPLEWRRLDGSKASRIVIEFPGGYRDDESEWQAIIEKMVDAMIRLEKTFSPFIAQLKAGG
ncbi:DUF4268 domain-containing protein [Gimesia maris]|uniref:DUF4268 domain-containing protein n=1 Tax=Gimesia maris TaxID=122 RepID=A0ABX5YR35_9PLAN|nr:DUF4268 domain-containing protein [Gimesia maris]EDL59264.1 hypothetical protein PM8797T_23494 [Gimesia maris DSM 8797]QEG18199.1 hypothetical protein GmarT_40850 [Gimesia maris]